MSSYLLPHFTTVQIFLSIIGFALSFCRPLTFESRIRLKRSLGFDKAVSWSNSLVPLHQQSAQNSATRIRRRPLHSCRYFLVDVLTQRKCMHLVGLLVYHDTTIVSLCDWERHFLIWEDNIGLRKQYLMEQVTPCKRG